VSFYDDNYEMNVFHTDTEFIEHMRTHQMSRCFVYIVSDTKRLRP